LCYYYFRLSVASPNAQSFLFFTLYTRFVSGTIVNDLDPRRAGYDCMSAADLFRLDLLSQQITEIITSLSRRAYNVGRLMILARFVVAGVVIYDNNRFFARLDLLNKKRAITSAIWTLWISHDYSLSR